MLRTENPLTQFKVKKGEVKTAIFEALKPVMAPAGFRLNKSEQGFVRRFECGKQSLVVPLWDYNPKFEFSLSMCIRLDVVEEITNRFSGSPAAYHSITQTIITQLEHLGVCPCRWQAVNESELQSRLAVVSCIVRDQVIPFFDCYRELSTIAAAANAEPVASISRTDSSMTTGMVILADRVLFSSGNHPYRAMSAIALAHVAHLENFDALVLRYQKELLPLHHQIEREKFNKLVEFLRGNERST